jgi:hypothetical protein
MAKGTQEIGVDVMKTLKRLIAVVVILMAAAFIVAMYSSQTAPVAVQTPEQQEQEKISGEDQERALIGAQILRKSMRNPDSFKLESVLVTMKGVVCYEYRAQNGFGGMNVEFAVLSPPYVGFNQNASAWNSRCAAKEVRHDETVPVLARM